MNVNSQCNSRSLFNEIKSYLGLCSKALMVFAGPTEIETSQNKINSELLSLWLR